MNPIEVAPSSVQLKFLQSQEDIVFFGGGAGGGKTYAALIDCLQYIHDPDFFAVYFRTNSTEISKGLWPAFLKIIKPMITDSKGDLFKGVKIREKDYSVQFPSGARVAFSYCQYDKDSDSWYGSEITRIYFEEFQFRSYYQFDVLKSRNRSCAKVPVGIRCTLNPDNSHFVMDFIKLFLDEEFYPIKDLSGKRAYFVIVEDIIYTSWDGAQLKQDHGKNPQTYTYIPATVDDNEYLDQAYRDRLDSMSEKKRKQLLFGCWAPVEDSGIYFQRSMFKVAYRVPLRSMTARGWDTAGTAPKEGHTFSRDADWTVGILISKCSEGDYYIHGMERFQKDMGPRDRHIINQAKRDGYDCTIVMAADVGSAGNFQFTEFSKKAIEEGLNCKKDPMPINKSKLTRAEPLITAVQQGFVYIVPSSFSEEEFVTLQVFFDEMEKFDGLRSLSKSGKWDDIVDATASAFNYLAQSRNIPIVTRNQQQTSTDVSNHIDSNLRLESFDKMSLQDLYN